MTFDFKEVQTPVAVRYPLPPPTLELLLSWLKIANKERRKHRERAARALALYLESDREERAFLRLLIATETARGSRIRARRAHERYDEARRSQSVDVPLDAVVKKITVHFDGKTAAFLCDVEWNREKIGEKLNELLGTKEGAHG